MNENEEMQSIIIEWRDVNVYGIKKGIRCPIYPFTLKNSRDDTTFLLTIKPVIGEAFELDLNDLTQYEQQISRFNENRSLRTFLEMVYLLLAM